MTKQELIEKLKEKSANLELDSVIGGYGGTNMPLLWQKTGVDFALKLAEQLDEPKEAEWKVIDRSPVRIIAECTACGYRTCYYTDAGQKYCPNCRAKIRRGV